MNEEELKRIKTLVDALKKLIPKKFGIFVFDKDMIKQELLESLIYAVMEINIGCDIERGEGEVVSV